MEPRRGLDVPGTGGDGVLVLRVGDTALSGHAATAEATTAGECHRWVSQAALGGVGSSFPSLAPPEQLPAVQGSVQPKSLAGSAVGVTNPEEPGSDQCISAG